jgi:hypothetical protein
MENSGFISRDFGNRHIVWFESTNQYIMLEKPAYEVLKYISKGYDPEHIVLYLTEKHSCTQDEARFIVTEIKQNLNKLSCEADSDFAYDNGAEVKYAECSFTPYSKKYYSHSGQIFGITYETALFESYLHPLFSHLQSKGGDIPTVNIELFSCEKRIIVRVGQNILGTYTKDQTHLLKGKIFFSIANLLHQKEDDEWLMAVHASAITNGKKTILFTASPGAGKSTFSALLQAAGLQLVSDDFVPIDHEYFAYSFPGAMSIKEGAWNILKPLYPSLDTAPDVKISSEKTVRYLRNELNWAPLSPALPVREVVFIRYDNNIPCHFAETDPITGISKLLEQTFIPSHPEYAGKMLDWAINIAFYELTYSDNMQAVEVVKKLFSNDK